MQNRHPLIPTIIRLALYASIVTFSYSQNVIIKGVVINPADKPVKKAIVTLRNLKDEIILEKITDRKGEFELEDIEPKFYYLLIEHEGDGSKRIKINPRKLCLAEILPFFSSSASAVLDLPLTMTIVKLRFFLNL